MSHSVAPYPVKYPNPKKPNTRARIIDVKIWYFVFLFMVGLVAFCINSFLFWEAIV